MKKLGKKINVSQESIEAYCRSCTKCGCSCYCSCSSTFAAVLGTVSALTSKNGNLSTTNAYNGSVASHGIA